MADESYVGFESVLYVWNSSAWVAVGSVRELTLNDEHGEIDVSRRGSTFRQKRLGLTNWEASGNAIKDHTDVGQTALRDAHRNRSTALVLIMDQSKDIAGAEGWQNTVEVRQWDESQPLEDGVTIDFVLQNHASDTPTPATGPVEDTVTLTVAAAMDAPELADAEPE